MSLLSSDLHRTVHNLKRHHFPFNEKDIPKNGIYLIFEDGEEGHGKDRVVRIGTHTGGNCVPVLGNIFKIWMSFIKY